MKSNSWQSVMNRKFMTFIIMFAVVAFWTSCSDQTQNLGPNAAAGAKGSAKSTSNFGDYNVSVVVSTDGATWTYTITKNAGAKNLSHFIVNLDNCGDQSATFDDILWATVNGQPVVFTDTEGQGTGCDPQLLTSNFVKFDNLAPATSYVIVVKFDRGYQLATTTGWLKAGTSCNSGSVPGPGCPINAVYCSMSQGYYFGNGWDNNGSTVVWGDHGVTVGGKTYIDQSECNQFWFSNAKSKSGVIKAFFQAAAIKLSGTDLSVDATLANDMAVIDAYYATKPQITMGQLALYGTATFPYTDSVITVPYADGSLNPDGTTKMYSSTVSAAGGRIGKWIDANHCQ